MENAKLEIIYQDEDVLVISKPSGLITFPEKEISEKTLIDLILEEFPYLKDVGRAKRYGIVHRLDRETSGILLVAKSNKSLFFLQKQFQQRKVIKKYTALVVGKIDRDHGEIRTLIGRSPKNRIKQRIYFPLEPDSGGKRKALTRYKVLKYFFHSNRAKERVYYTLVEVGIDTGRRHQIRVHFNYLGHPIAGDKLYSFKNQVPLVNLKRQFLHASFLKIKLPDGRDKEFESKLPNDLNKVLKSLHEISQ
jgi:23S rRNA pseudouridine1911/1915/1917 synthase